MPCSPFNLWCKVIVLARLLNLCDKLPLGVMQILQSLQLNFLPHLIFLLRKC